MTDSETVSSAFFERYDELVRAFYSAAAGSGTWQKACTLLADSLGLWTLQILGVDPRTGALQFSWDGGTVPQQAWLEYFTTYHQINPRVPAAIKLPLNGWLHDHAHFDRATFDNAPFFRDFMIPYGGRYSSTCKIIDEADLIVFLSAHPHQTRPPLNRAEIGALEKIRDHVVAAIGLYRKLQRGAAESLVARAMLDAIDQPVLLIDDTRAVHHANRSAVQVMARSESLHILNGFLRCKNPNDSDRLSYLLRQLGLGGNPDGLLPKDRAVIRIGLNGRPPEFVVVAVAVRPEASGSIFGTLPRAILLPHALNGTAQVEPIVLSHAYDMTPAEAMVAAAIANGSSPIAVAKARGVSVATVRAQLREIYAKVGVTRQAELVQTLSQMPRKSLEVDRRRLVL